MLKGRDTDKWVRIYATLFDLYKLILVPCQTDVDSILDPSRSKMTTSVGPLTNPAFWLDKLSLDWRTVPLYLGFGTEIMRTSGPNTPPGIGSLAMVREDA